MGILWNMIMFHIEHTHHKNKIVVIHNVLKVWHPVWLRRYQSRLVDEYDEVMRLLLEQHNRNTRAPL